MMRRPAWRKLGAASLWLTLLLASVEVVWADAGRCDPLGELAGVEVERDGAQTAPGAPEAPRSETGDTDCRCLCDCGCPGAVPAIVTSTIIGRSLDAASVPVPTERPTLSQPIAEAPPFRPA